MQKFKNIICCLSGHGRVLWVLHSTFNLKEPLRRWLPVMSVTPRHDQLGLVLIGQHICLSFIVSLLSFFSCLNYFLPMWDVLHFLLPLFLFPFLLPLFLFLLPLFIVLFSPSEMSVLLLLFLLTSCLVDKNLEGNITRKITRNFRRNISNIEVQSIHLNMLKGHYLTTKCDRD